MTLALILIGVFVAFLTGALAAFGSPVLLILFIGVVAGAVLIAKPRLSVWVVLVGGLVVSGLVELYLPGLQQIRWGVALLSMTLIAISLGIAALTAHRDRKDRLDPAAKAVLAAAVGLVICAMLTVVANSSSLGASAVGLKNYFQMFGLLAAFAVFRYTPEHASRFMRVLLILGLLQIPFVLHQFIELVPQRSSLAAAAKGVVAVDIVAGTFGGSMYGGGRSSTLALLSSILIVLVLAQWRAGARSMTSSAIYVLAFTLPMALNEAKLFLLLLPVGLFLLFRDRILRNPLKAVASVIFLVVVLSSLFAVYAMLPGAKSQRTVSIDKFLENSIEYNFGQRGYGNSVLNRTTVYSFWWKENVGHGHYLKALLGHGPGATNASSAVASNTIATTRYKGYAIGLTGVSALLWEIGILGSMTALSFLFMTYRLGAKLEKRWQNTPHWPYVRVAQLAMPLVAISLLHNSYFVSDISFQALLFLFVGYLAAMSRYSPETQP